MHRIPESFLTVSMAASTLLDSVRTCSLFSFHLLSVGLMSSILFNKTIFFIVLFLDKTRSCLQACCWVSPGWPFRKCPSCFPMTSLSYVCLDPLRAGKVLHVGLSLLRLFFLVFFHRMFLLFCPGWGTLSPVAL